MPRATCEFYNADVPRAGAAAGGGAPGRARAARQGPAAGEGGEHSARLLTPATGRGGRSRRRCSRRRPRRWRSACVAGGAAGARRPWRRAWWTAGCGRWGAPGIGINQESIEGEVTCQASPESWRAGSAAPRGATASACLCFVSCGLDRRQSVGLIVDQGQIDRIECNHKEKGGRGRDEALAQNNHFLKPRRAGRVTPSLKRIVVMRLFVPAFVPIRPPRFLTQPPHTAAQHSKTQDASDAAAPVVPAAPACCRCRCRSASRRQRQAAPKSSCQRIAAHSRPPAAAAGAGLRG